MGFLDRFKHLFHHEQAKPEEKPPITLERGREAEWTSQLLKHTGLDDEFERFSAQVEAAKQDVLESLAPFTDDKRLAQVPERARTVAALHGSQYAKQVRKLLEQAQFDELFTFEEGQEGFQRALDEFRDQTKKNVSVLGEYLGEELRRTQDGIKRIEDTAIALLQAMEERQFGHIRKLHESQEQLARHDEKLDRHRELLDNLERARDAARQKREKVEAKITEQRGLVRNQQALQALDELGKVEEELDQLAARYERACGDAVRYYKKSKAAPPKEAAGVLTDLPKDAARYLANNAAAIQTAFAAVADHLEGERVGNLTQRLQGLSVEQDSARARELLPKQAELRRGVMGDVATLMIYDQQQFLLRARREEAEAEAKIAYVQEQLEGSERTVLEQQAKDAVLALGATIEHAEEQVAESSGDDSIGHAVEEAEHELGEAGQLTDAKELLRKADDEAHRSQ